MSEANDPNLTPNKTIIISIILITVGLGSLYFLTQFSIVDFSKTGSIGDTFGGILNPFIALVGAFLTYMAFYIQYQANKVQRQQFKDQLAEDKQQFRDEIKAQQVQFEKVQFENQFYEMLRLHKENVNEISITQIFSSGRNQPNREKEIKGRDVFKYLLEEIGVTYEIAKQIWISKKPDFVIDRAYSIFFMGISSYKIDDDQISANKDFIKKLRGINNRFSSSFFLNLDQYLDEAEISYDLKLDLHYSLFKGHSSSLAHYYRHLYQTVKFVANQDEGFLSYNEKRKYLRILRAQLSNQEQAMLFYNWKSNFGSQWQNKNNQFFTDYRMIHNLTNDLLISDFKLDSIFHPKDQDFRSENEREFDPLFEYEDY